MITDEHRKLADYIIEGEGLPKEWWDERDNRKSKDIEIEWTAKLLADFERKVRLEAFEEAAQLADKWMSERWMGSCAEAIRAHGAELEAK